MIKVDKTQPIIRDGIQYRYVNVWSDSYRDREKRIHLYSLPKGTDGSVIYKHFCVHSKSEDNFLSGLEYNYDKWQNMQEIPKFKKVPWTIPDHIQKKTDFIVRQSDGDIGRIVGFSVKEDLICIHGTVQGYTPLSFAMYFKNLDGSEFYKEVLA